MPVSGCFLQSSRVLLVWLDEGAGDVQDVRDDEIRMHGEAPPNGGGEGCAQTQSKTLTGQESKGLCRLRC